MALYLPKQTITLLLGLNKLSFSFFTQKVGHSVYFHLKKHLESRKNKLINRVSQYALKV